ncbi:hypothetical protein Leryth_027500 [Lithospermum erythrorhizon]|nr:hypothetical protein Leryth_027500 [Lithospermum erythrorhizon]
MEFDSTHSCNSRLKEMVSLIYSNQFGYWVVAKKVTDRRQGKVCIELELQLRSIAKDNNYCNNYLIK